MDIMCPGPRRQLIPQAWGRGVLYYEQLLPVRISSPRRACAGFKGCRYCKKGAFQAPHWKNDSARLEMRVWAGGGYPHGEQEDEGRRKRSLKVSKLASPFTQGCISHSRSPFHEPQRKSRTPRTHIHGCGEVRQLVLWTAGVDWWMQAECTVYKVRGCPPELDKVRGA
ncbi:hypothetical protein NDU88_003017 [Pleurodeles waltl]|uniref:Uncharacterized protein n=1 Tax=Pleurodeles waltl TaxID=8319 RepID=A0AAV7UE03_PLEWA|nr:hypothetical protein NDU88_003017 [Pleurodeles waltl]